MGWGDATSIFEAVACSLIEADADDVTIRHVLYDLIYLLQAGDWDGERECLERFRNYPPVVEAFRRQGITLD